jgi:hypothetical protein
VKNRHTPAEWQEAAKKKDLPSDWSLAKLSYFAGLLSASRAIGEIGALCEVVNQEIEPGSPSWFFSYVQRLKPWVSISIWNGCMETVERVIRI